MKKTPLLVILHLSLKLLKTFSLLGGAWKSKGAILFSAVENELIVIRSEGQHLAAGEKRDNTKQDHED